MNAARSLVTVLPLLLLPGLATAQLSPRATLEDFLGRAGALLQEAAEPTQAWPGVQRLAADLFDGELAARRTLGAEWPRRSEAQRAELAGLLGGAMANAFLEMARATLPRDRPPAMHVLTEDITAEGATVRTTIRGRDGNDLRLDYRMVRPAGRWRVQDVIVDGVSMVENYRAQFARIARGSSPAAAMSALRRLAVAPATAPSSALAADVVAYFPTGGAMLSAAALGELDRLAGWLAANQHARVVLESHADARGEAGLNRALAEQRAATVRRHLVSRGVDDARIAAVVHGARQPVCRESTEACWAQNRRVVVRPAPADRGLPSAAR